MCKTSIEKYNKKKKQLEDKIDKYILECMRLALTSINNFFLIIFDIDNGGN